MWEKIIMDKSKENTGVFYKRCDYAGFVKRAIIAAIDSLVLIIISFLFILLSSYIISDEKFLIKFNFLAIALISMCYLAILKPSKYRTFGYKLTNVKIVDLKGKKPTLFKMILRTLLLLIAPFGLIFDIIWLTSEETKQTLRDKYIGTYVVSKDASPIGQGKFQIVSLGFMGFILTYWEIKKD